MPYPAKTDASSILAAAIVQLEAFGPAGLSMRTLAGALGITAHALYRYFPDRAALESAIAEESHRELLGAMRTAADQQSPIIAATVAAEAYLAFAGAHPARYALMLAAPHEPGKKSQAQESVWQFVLELLARMTGQQENEDAALALWALMHGFVALQKAGIAHEIHVERGLAIFLAGLVSSAETKEAQRDTENTDIFTGEHGK
jgi:AcrR family transcriptional regulator